jgi:hypothetical protein
VPLGWGLAGELSGGGQSVALSRLHRLGSLKLFYQEYRVTKLVAIGALTVLTLAVAGCTTPQQQAAQKEDLLAAAGFQVRIADTPQRLAALKRLPPNKFVTRVVNGQPVYQYADPLVCRCVYFGTQQNWAAYRQEVLAQRLADEAQMTAMMNQEAWEWGPWGWP